VLDALTNNVGTCDFTLNGGKLDLNGYSQAMNGLNSSPNTVVDNSSASPVTLVIGGNGDGSTNNGAIQNSGGGALALQVNGGNVQLLATNTYSGGTVFNGGRLYFPNAASLSTGPVTFNPGSGAYAAGRTFTNVLTLNGAYLRVGGANNNVQTWSGPVTAINGFEMSGDTGTWGVTLSGPMNIGAGGISITNSGSNGTQMGFGVSTTGDLLSGTISGSGGITYYLVGGYSRVTVQGTNTYGGNTIVNGIPDGFGNGKLNVYGGNLPFSTGAVTLNAGATIESAPGSATVTNALTLAGGTLQSEPQYNNYNTLTWSGPITLTADSALVQNATGALNSNQSSGVNVAGALNMNSFTLTCSSPVTCYGGNTISGPISGAGNILQNGNNSLTVSGSNTFSGTFRSVLGTLSIKNSNALQNATLDMNAADAGTVSLSTNAIIGALTGSRDVNLGSYTVSIGNNNATTTFSGALTNGGSFIKVGSGTLTLSGVTTLPGNTTVNGGTLSFSQAPFGSNSTVKVAGGAVLNLNYSGSTTIQGLVLNSVSQPAGTYGSGNSGGLITGTGVLVVSPPNCWIGNTSTSWTQASNWALSIVPGNGSNAVFNFYSTANLATVLNANFNLNTLLLANPSAPVSVAAGGAFTLTLTNGIDMSAATQPLTITAPVLIGAPQTWSVANNITLSVNSPVSGTNLTVSGGGIVSLGGTNTYTGTTSISGTGSTLQISGAGQLGSGSYTASITVGGGTTLQYSSSANQTLGSILSTGNLIKDTSSASTLTIGGAAGAGRTSGNTTVSAGTLAVNSTGSLLSTSTYQANSIVTVNSGATLSLYSWAYGAAGSIGALDTGAARLRVNGGTIVYTGVGEGSGSTGNGRVFTIGTGGATLDAEGSGTWFIEPYDSKDGSTGQGISSSLTLTLTGAKNGRYDKFLSGAGSLVKSGAGIWTLTNTNSYAGGTAVNGGILFVNNTAGSGTGTGAVNINNAGTLSGTGIISGLVTNNAGGTLNPGATNIGKLTLNGSVTLLANSTNTFLVNGSTGVASNSVGVGAAITYGGVLNIVTNGTFTLGQSFQLFSGTGATNASNFASIVGNPGTGLAFSFTNGILSVVSAVTGPTLTSVAPNPVSGSSYGVTLNLGGTGFTGATAVLLTNLTANTGASYVPVVNSSTSISVTFVPGTTASSWNATVVNGTPSMQAGFTVTAPAKVTINSGNLNSGGAGKLVLSGTGGVAGNSYAVLSATNLNPPVVWTPLVTNLFGAGGSYSYTNTISGSTPKLFLRIQQ
jgi:autotransporter-associated beta strand protein